MNNRIILCISALLCASPVQGQATANAPYAGYSTMKKEVSVLEWRLLQINLMLSEHGYLVYFDERLNLFKVDKIIRTTTLKYSPADVREILVTDCNLVASTIGVEFPEFRMRDSKDLMITFTIGDKSRRHFASYLAGSFSFTEDYYSFRKEHGL